MEDLREVTHNEHFELYRKKRLEEMGFEDETGSVERSWALNRVDSTGRWALIGVYANSIITDKVISS